MPNSLANISSRQPHAALLAHPNLGIARGLPFYLPRSSLRVLCFGPCPLGPSSQSHPWDKQGRKQHKQQHRPPSVLRPASPLTYSTPTAVGSHTAPSAPWESSYKSALGRRQNSYQYFQYLHTEGLFTVSHITSYTLLHILWHFLSVLIWIFTKLLFTNFLNSCTYSTLKFIKNIWIL